MPGFVLTNNVQFLPVKISVYWQSDRLVLKTKNAAQRESVVCGVVWCGVCVCVCVCVSVCVCVCHMHVRVHVLDGDRNRLFASTSRASVIT